jgi:hypothetical protein
MPSKFHTQNRRITRQLLRKALETGEVLDDPEDDDIPPHSRRDGRVVRKRIKDEDAEYYDGR